MTLAPPVEPPGKSQAPSELYYSFVAGSWFWQEAIGAQGAGRDCGVAYAPVSIVHIGPGPEAKL